jgi:hypothetical protein
MAHRTGVIPWFVVAATLLAAASSASADVEPLQRSFEQPPDDARIMMRWWWFGPAVTREGLAREMKVMKDGGLGGFEVQPVYPLALDDATAGIKNLPFLSPEFLDALAFTAGEAKRLGLRFDLTLGSGWPYGGSMITLAQSPGCLRIESTPLAAGRRTVAVPKLRDDERLLAAFVGPPSQRHETRGTRHETGNTGRGTRDKTPVFALVSSSKGGYREVEVRDRAVQIPADLDGPAQILFFISSHTGDRPERPGVGAEGHVIDHYDPRVIDTFIRSVADPEIRACGANPPYAVFCDSLEIDGEDWTDHFLAEFQRRRGYDLRPHLPALVDDTIEGAKEIRHDWGRTLTEITNDTFLGTFRDWAHEHGTRFRIQGYGTPPATLHSYAYVDLPEGEGSSWKLNTESRWASSASHLLGRPVTSSETWTWLHSPVFRATPLDMKGEADLHFLQGVNQLVGHGWPYSPPGTAYPGWSFFAAAALDEKNPWWIVMPDVAQYLQRVSHMLRQGLPANDIAVYLSNSDGWARFTPGDAEMNAQVVRGMGHEVVRQILAAGDNLDFFDDQLLRDHGRVVGGTLAFGDVRFKVAVLVNVERIPAATMRQLDAFARGGGLIIATRRLPSSAPGFRASDEDKKAVREIAHRLFEGPDAPGIFLPSDDQLGATLAEHLRPDVAFSHTSPSPPPLEIGFVHRRTDSAEIYFLANTSYEPKGVPATFRVEGMQPEWWDPMTGGVTAAEVLDRPEGGTTVRLVLEPYGSRLLVFTRRTLPTPPVGPPVASVPPPLDLSRDWSVSFGPGRPPVAMQTLHSWTDDEATRFFSGVATYEKTVAVPDAMLQEGLGWQLHFGESRPPAVLKMRHFFALIEAPVREAAVVYVNDERAGSVWHPPYTLDVTGLLRLGENRIRVDVANLALNHLAGHPPPDDSALHARYGKRFDRQDMHLVRPIRAGRPGPFGLAATAGARSSGGRVPTAGPARGGNQLHPLDRAVGPQ